MATPVTSGRRSARKRKSDSSSDTPPSGSYALPATPPKRRVVVPVVDIRLRDDLDALQTEDDKKLPPGYEYDDDPPLVDDTATQSHGDEHSKSDGSEIFGKAVATKRVRNRHTVDAGTVSDEEGEGRARPADSEEEEEDDDGGDDGEDEDDDDSVRVQGDGEQQGTTTPVARKSPGRKRGKAQTAHDDLPTMGWDGILQGAVNVIGRAEGAIVNIINEAYDCYYKCRKSQNPQPRRFAKEPLIETVKTWRQYWYVDRTDNRAVTDMLNQLGDEDDPRGVNQDSAYKKMLRTHDRLDELLRLHGIYSVKPENYSVWMKKIKTKIDTVATFRRGKINLLLGGDNIDIPGTLGMIDEVNQLHEPDKLKSHQKLIQYLKKRFRAEKLLRYGSQVYEEVLHNGYHTRAYKDKYETRENSDKTGMDQFVYEFSSQAACSEMYFNRTENLSVHANVVKELQNCTDLPDLRRTRGLWSFGNGRYDGRKWPDAYYPYDYDSEPEDIKQLHSIHFIPTDLRDTESVGPDFSIEPRKDGRGSIYRNADGVVLWDTYEKTGTNPCYTVDGVKLYPYNPSNQSTTAVDIPRRKARSIKTVATTNLMLGQWHKDNVGAEAGQIHKWLYGLLGRLSMPLGTKRGGDDLQVIPMLYGLAGTGKSTLIKAIVKMYPRNDVFHMESEGEGTFQLQKAPGKFMWCIQELKKNLRLPSGRFQNMVSGEHMPIPRKNRDEYSEEFILPGIIAGNDRMPFSDAQGSISRRVISFEYTQSLTNPDTTLDQQIEQELPDLIRKCVMIWRTELMRIGSRHIWAKNVLCPYFHTTRANLKKHVDVCVAYIMERKNCAICPDPKDLDDKDNYVMPLSELVLAIKKTLPTDQQSTVSEDSVKISLEQSAFEVFELGCVVVDATRTRYVEDQAAQGTMKKTRRKWKMAAVDQEAGPAVAEAADSGAPAPAAEDQRFPLAAPIDDVYDGQVHDDDDNDMKVDDSSVDPDDDDVLLDTLDKKQSMVRRGIAEGRIIEKRPISVEWGADILTAGLFVRGVTLVTHKGKCRIVREAGPAAALATPAAA